MQLNDSKNIAERIQPLKNIMMMLVNENFKSNR